VCWLIFKGYIFNTADQGESLSLVYKALDNSLYSKDFYVSSCEGVFTIRYFYVHVLAFLGQWIPMSYLCFGLEFICLTASIAAYLKIAQWLSPRISDFYSTVPFWMLFFFYGWTVGGNSLQYSLLISSTFAKALAPWGLYFALKRKWVLSCLLIGVAALFQLLVGLQLALVIGASLLLVQRNIKAWAIFTLGFVISGGAMIFPIVYRQFFAPASQSDDSFYEILYVLRNPHHYLPSLFSWTSYLKFFVLLMVGNVCLYVLLPKDKKRLLWTFQGWIIVGLTVYTLALEVFHVNVIGKLQWFKTTIWLQGLSAMAIGLAFDRFLNHFWPTKRMFIIFMLPVFWIIQGHFRFETPLSFDHRTAEQKSLTLLHQWIEHNTPLDALFVTSPEDEAFICEAKRSQWVAWNPIIHEPWYLLEWKRRFSELYGQPFDGSDYLNTLETAEKYYQQSDFTKTPADYALVRRASLAFIKKPFSILYEKDGFVVLKF
jgi:hypothetical protein